jgi:DNA-binding transcriptional regulator YiaG
MNSAARRPEAQMPNIASVLKAEITRLARKEMRENSDGLRKVVAAHRTEIATLKRRIQALEATLKRLSRGQAVDHIPARAGMSKESVEAAEAGRRFSAKGMAVNRKRLGLSAADFALLVGTTGQSVYAWEAGKSKPRLKAMAAIASLRRIGKREVADKLASLKG